MKADWISDFFGGNLLVFFFFFYRVLPSFILVFFSLFLFCCWAHPLRGHRFAFFIVMIFFSSFFSPKKKERNDAFLSGLWLDLERPNFNLIFFYPINSTPFFISLASVFGLRCIPFDCFLFFFLNFHWIFRGFPWFDLEWPWISWPPLIPAPPL